MTAPENLDLLSPTLDPDLAHLAVGLFSRLDRLAALLEADADAGAVRAASVDWHGAHAFRWVPDRRARGDAGRLVPVPAPALISFDALANIERQVALVRQNTRQFVLGHPANNVLLTGARGTGKSSLVKACLHAFAARGLRLVEVGKDGLDALPMLFELLRGRPERFIVSCDDLSFEAGETGYKALKTVLDGSIAGGAPNVLIYATSNRRHLVPEQASDNAAHTLDEHGELHPGDAVEERISLSERFGLWVTFYGFSQDEYLRVVDARLHAQGYAEPEREAARQPALQWALQRGARSGRIAVQFVQDYVGRRASDAA
ncbi:ATP-binding protein [Burkholderia sp. FERM BP-3421]|uniref:ATP-binding protein n=1 Tax=Burkholderia sp. FERM BP-3421 TaxID=1494466 RepID=UPI00235DDC1F|nr:ATP-binding protein [Burkholderia sp. FERM BP-3421]WDD93635.1 ATP-binding protein [Burkholderia sp. FERM BP-3421]